MAQMLLRTSRLGIGLPVKGGDHGERLRRNWTCSEGCGGTLTERSSRDVSIGYFAILAIGSTLWASYGVSLGNLAILIPNVVASLPISPRCWSHIGYVRKNNSTCQGAETVMMMSWRRPAAKPNGNLRSRTLVSHS